MPDASLIKVKDFFGFANITEFRTSWNTLNDAEKAQLRAGIGDGSLTY